jgi:ribonuclease Z
MTPGDLSFGNLRLEGRSWAGDETWFRVHPPGLAVDVGRGALQLAGAEWLLITHGHLDHALGVPYVLSQRSLHQAARTHIVCPRSLAEPLERLIDAAADMEAASYDYRLYPASPGDRFEVASQLFAEVFAVDHTVPALGYHLVRRGRRLKPEYQETAGDRLAALRRQGVPLEDTVDELMISFCSDSGPRLFELEPRLLDTPILVVECTFIGEEERERAHRFGHLHVDDFAAVADRLRAKSIVLHHLSRRYDSAALLSVVKSTLPRLSDRIQLLLGPR